MREMRDRILRALLTGEIDDEPGHWQLQVNVGAITGSLCSQEFSSARQSLVEDGLILFHKKRQGSLLALTDAGRNAAKKLPAEGLAPKVRKRKYTTRVDYHYETVEPIKPPPESRKCLFCGKTFKPEHYAQYIHAVCKQNEVFRGDLMWT